MPFNKHVIFLLSLLMVIISCQKDEKAIQHSPGKITFTGTTNDLKAFKYFNVLNHSYLFATNHKNSNKELIDSSMNLVLDSIRQSGIMRIFALGDSARYNYKVFVTPSDNITINLANKKIQFEGHNAPHYNFFELIKELETKKISFTEDFITYKKESLQNLNEKNTFLKNYIVDNPKVSNDFIETIQADFEFKYLLELITPLRDNHYPNDKNKYFDNVELSKFNRPDLLNNQNFKEAFVNYIRYYFVDNQFNDYSKEKFLAEKEFILSNFTNDIQRYAITRLINDYYKNITDDNINNVLSLIEDYKEFISKPSYLKAIDKVENALFVKHGSLSKKALRSELIDLDGNILTVNDLLNNENIIVIDFWASWCAPCISEIKQGIEYRRMMTQTKNIQWVYLSMDKNKNDWIKKSNQMEAYGLTKNQYLIVNTRQSELLKFLKISAIPRYVILDKKKIIIAEDAPRPTDTNKFEEIINKINL